MVKYRIGNRYALFGGDGQWFENCVGGTVIPFAF
jgi:hypothetical protein